ncbi:UDP-glycosyltransferase UGT4-like [Musca domestica]|nr:UDP-glycosyltransferase UGT4-like [Musca domestica]
MNEKFYGRHFPNATKSVEEIQKKFALVLLNDHPAISSPKPYVPNMLDVAGLHIPEKPKPLPQHVGKILNATSQGFIYVAIGNPYPDNVMQRILQQFQMLNHTIVWNTNHSPSAKLRIPRNVKFYPKISHYAVLEHPKCKLLISEAGFLSVIESIHYGLTILGLRNIYGKPGEFFDAVEKIKTGISVKLGPNSLKDNHIYWSVVELLQNENYTKLAKIKSLQLRDQQNTPMQRAIFGIEYVLRHNGAAHLRNLRQNLNSWQFYNLDVWLILCLVVLTVLAIFYMIVYFCGKVVRKAYRRKYKND